MLDPDICGSNRFVVRSAPARNGLPQRGILAQRYESIGISCCNHIMAFASSLGSVNSDDPKASI